ncbi:DUF5990 family protein [Pseudoduganella dura]|uniref:DUF5990 family protein n=1 Tax=Pseudoduganella dura TaxID=321982 RepID=UPI003531377B
MRGHGVAEPGAGIGFGASCSAFHATQADHKPYILPRTRMSKFPRDMQVSLFCKSLPSFDEPATAGIQDKNQCVHEGLRMQDGSFESRCVVQMRNKAGDSLDVFGPFVHGTPSTRFICLSWKHPG